MNFHKGLMMMLLAAVFAMPAFAQEEAKAENWLEKRFGKELVNAKGEKVATATLKGKTVGIYFSAHWCPPCRKLTPQLVTLRDAVAKDNFEIVFISSDKDEEAMKGYMKETKMGWLAVPFNAKQRNAVQKEYSVSGIPTLIILDQDGKTIMKEIGYGGETIDKVKKVLNNRKKAQAEKTENAEK